MIRQWGAFENRTSVVICMLLAFLTDTGVRGVKGLKKSGQSQGFDGLILGAVSQSYP